jgi:hypothetical protein
VQTPSTSACDDRGGYQPTQGDKVGAGFLNVVYVPGKAILCSFGAVASAGMMLLTFGNAYHAAVELFRGCGGVAARV